MTLSSPRLAPPSLSLVVPTYREVENLGALIEAIDRLRVAHQWTLELWIMDDDSRDGTEELIARFAQPWVHLVVRTANRGLSQAVVDGLRRARHDVLLVMDADLSHPPEQIPALVARLEEGCDFVIGSRYVAGGSTDAAWGAFRWLNSKIATLLARPFTSVGDPMAGFFALRRTTFQRADPLSPVGYKIGLELIVKCRCQRVAEVPIHFVDRQQGQSKLTLKEQLRYVQHLRRLALYKFPNRAYFLQFAVVGALGTVVNLGMLTVCLSLLQMPAEAAIACGIGVSLVSNFLLNRRFTFSYARNGPLLRQFAAYAAACSVGLVVNYGVSLAALHYLTQVNLPLPQLAALCGIATATVFDFLASRYLVFRQRSTCPSVTNA